MKLTDARIVAYRIIDESRPQPKLYDFASQSRERNLTAIATVAGTLLTVALLMAGVVSLVAPIATQVEGLLR